MTRLGCSRAHGVAPSARPRTPAGSVAIQRARAGECVVDRQLEQHRPGQVEQLSENVEVHRVCGAAAAGMLDPASPESELYLISSTSASPDAPSLADGFAGQPMRPSPPHREQAGLQRRRYRPRQPRHAVQRLDLEARGAVAVQGLEPIAHLPAGRERHAPAAADRTPSFAARAARPPALHAGAVPRGCVRTAHRRRAAHRRRHRGGALRPAGVRGARRRIHARPPPPGFQDLRAGQSAPVADGDRRRGRRGPATHRRARTCARPGTAGRSARHDRPGHPGLRHQH